MSSKENEEWTLFGLAHLSKTSFWFCGPQKIMLHTGKVELATICI